ncbi:hypothetical protein HELRODRAFT_191101 [Helobdella robusta]|uniref:Rho-GAP domain-containing protein n=1 Tax=Helobdella robusta TaxID=6412 RepID=T1FSL2_HELRO|nr:hypothetical protein HELRODRAFT_191101 [Helobdella robusta]ESO07227.1 hypothetical protein HELRODRAFT_191101 [Helobdella robusta]
MDSLIEPLVACSSSESPPSPSSTSANDVTTAATKRESTSSTASAYSSVNSSSLEPSDSSSYLSSSSAASQATTTTSSYAKKRDQIVEKFRQNYPERFLKLVTMHLSFLMNLQDDGLEELLEGQNESSKNTPAQNQNGGEKLVKFFTIKRKTTKDDKPSKLFGGNLTTEAIRRILPLINYLSEDEHCQREGIFRISGNSERQKELRELLNSAPQEATEGREADARHDFLTDISTTRFTVNDVATTFKSFLGELPEPLMSSRYYNSYLQIAAMRDSVKQLQCLQLLRFLLPNENATMLRLLLDLLNKVAAFWQLNKMSADNLAIIFTQHLFISKKLPVSQLKEATDTLKPLVVLMISNNRSLTSHNNCPEQLVHDVIRSANDVSRRRKETESESAEVESSGLKKGKKFSKTSNKKNKSKKKDVKQNDDDDDDDGVINSIYTFSDREASRLAAQNDCTKKALEDLYSTIYTMTESAKKRRYVKNINKNDQLTTIATPTSRSFYGSHNSRRSGVSLLKVMSERRNGPYNCLPHQLNKYQQPTNTPGKQNPTVYTNNNNTSNNYTSNNNKYNDSELHSRTPISTYSPHLPVLRLFQAGSNDTIGRNVDHSSDIYDSPAIECIPINLSINFDAATETTPHQQLQLQHQKSHQLENMSKLNDNKDDDDEGDDDDVIASMEESTSCKKSSNNDSTIVYDSDDDVDNGDDDGDNNNNNSSINNNKNNNNNNNNNDNNKNSDDDDEEKENFSPRKLRGYISPLNYLPNFYNKFTLPCASP